MLQRSNRSNEPARRLGGVLAIDELIDFKVTGDDAAKTAKFADYLGRVLQDSSDRDLLEVAAATMGHLVKAGGAVAADIVEQEVRRVCCE